MRKRWMVIPYILLLLVTASPALMQGGDSGAPTSTPAELVVTGHVINDFYPDLAAGGMCHIAVDAPIWAVALNGRNVLAYTVDPACEGLLSIQRGALVQIEWDDEALLTELPQAEVAEQEPYEIDGLNDYCLASADNPVQGSAPNVERPYRVTIMQHGMDYEHYPAAMLATSDDDVDVVVCTENDVQVLGSCRYSGGGQIRNVEVQRRLTRIWLIDYATGQTFSENTFYGSDPGGCPDTRTTWAPIQGTVPDGYAWVNWLVGQVYNTANPVAHTTVGTGGALNARAEANTQSEILTQLAAGTPVTPIARNEAGDWVVAYLPDGQQAWLYLSLLQVATPLDVMALPVAAGPAADVKPPLP